MRTRASARGARLRVAAHIAAEAGLTGVEFRNMVKDGQVTSDQFKSYLIPALEAYAGTSEAMAGTPIDC